jgi:outer membrane protein assembly factor BamB
VKKLPRAFSIVLILIILAFAIPKILNLYVYIKLDTSNFPLVKKWSSNLSDSILELSATDNGLFVFARTANALYSIDTSTGRVLWHFPLVYQAVTFPAIAKNGFVYIADAKKLWALDQRTGDIVWNQSLSEPRGRVETVTDISIFVNNSNTDIGVYDVKTGSLVWKFPLYWYHPKFYVRENKIYIPQNGLYILDIATGKDAVVNDKDSIFDSVIYNSDVYYATLDNIVAFNTKTGSETWREKRAFSNYDYPRLDINGQFIIVEGAESLTTLNRETGDMIWNTSTSYPMNPSVIGNTIFVMEGYDRIIRAFQITTGKEIGKLRASSYHFLLASNQRDMIAVGNQLIFSRGNELLCFTSANK